MPKFIYNFSDFLINELVITSPLPHFSVLLNAFDCSASILQTEVVLIFKHLEEVKDQSDDMEPFLRS